MLRPHQRSAFTLIEILVVVTIIITLIAIALPALSHARETARRSAVQSQMSGISTACESYYQNFRAYPGLLAESTYTSASTFTSSQALVVSLSRFFCTPNADSSSSASTVQIPGAPVVTYVSTDPSVSPRDYSENTTPNAVNNPTGRTYTPYITAKSTDLSGSITNSNVADLAVLPTFIDGAYGTQAMPILYFRATRKYDRSVISGGSNMAAVGSSTAFASFNGDANAYLANSTVVNSMPGPYSSSNISGLITNLDAGNDPSNILTETINGTTGVTTRGGFVLISAGADRKYGTSDDIIIAGGS